MPKTAEHRPLVTAGVTLGIGLGGFFDGILFHQLLQLHNMMSATRPKTSIVNLEINMFWDGLFHGFCWIFTLLGIILLYRAGTLRAGAWSARVLAGAMIFGWGLFNFVEGLLDHFILGIHHVVERLGLSVWDYAFVVLGAVMMIVGGSLIRAERRERYPMGLATHV